MFASTIKSDGTIKRKGKGYQVMPGNTASVTPTAAAAAAVGNAAPASNLPLNINVTPDCHPAAGGCATTGTKSLVTPNAPRKSTAKAPLRPASQMSDDIEDSYQDGTASPVHSKAVPPYQQPALKLKRGRDGQDPAQVCKTLICDRVMAAILIVT